MDIANSIFFNFFSVGSLILFAFGMFVVIFIITLKNKSISTVHLGIACFFLAFFHLDFFVAFSLYHPLAAYQRYFEPFILFAEIHLIIFFITYPDNKHKSAARIFFIVLYSITIIALVAHFIKLYKVKTIFRFDGHLWAFSVDKMAKVIGLLIILYLFIGAIVIIWKMIKDKKYRFTYFSLGSVFLLSGGIPAITHIMNINGLINREVHQLTLEAVYVFGFFIMFLVFINYAKERTSYMTKIIGISLLSLQCLLLGISYFTTQEQEKLYDEAHNVKTILAITNLNKKSSDLEYLIEYSLIKNTSVLKYNKNNASLDVGLIENEMINTVIYEKIKNISDTKFNKRLIHVLNDKHEFFNGYKNLILELSQSITQSKKYKGVELTKKINSVKRLILSQFLKINKLNNETFRTELQNLLKTSNSKLFQFNKALLMYLSKNNLQGGELKKNILKFHTPMNPSGTRNYRTNINSQTHYTSFIEISADSKIIHEAGFSYLTYREFMHPISQKLIIMLLVVYLFIVLGYPAFFYGSLIKPLMVLRNGHAKVMNGELDFNIKIKIQDEIGYITHFFNKMTKSLKETKIQLDDYTNNLEEKIFNRTQELQVAMEEMETINEQLIVTQDALWGEMEIAKKIQTKLLPPEPSIDNYDISLFMEPADEVGGDYYDIINTANMDWIVIGDVSGHGVPAGLIMMMTQTAINTALFQNPDITPDKLLNIVNRTITENTKRLNEDKYMTITVLAAINNGKFIFSGLHQDIIIYRASTAKIDFIETRGMWIGIIDDIQNMLELDSLIMEPGDIMLLYSDGITEARKKSGSDNTLKLYGNENLGKFLEKNASLQVDEIKNALLEELHDYECDDDITMIILKRNI